MTNFEKVKKIIVEELGVDENDITLDANVIEDLGADSLSVIEMIMNFESEYGITLPDEALNDLETVGDIVKALDDIGLE